MRFESVTAHQFGPFTERTLQLAPGMTVVYGPNEAGKSSWHAALFAGLCGTRRGRGRGRDEDQRFSARHRPWDGTGWAVGAVVQLADGRRVELHHDLDGKVDCRAADADLGRDYSNQIMFDGAPDGSRFLGLDRRAFIAIACVQQADLLGVLEKPDLLQEHLQRAAATAGTNSTAASALDRLEKFRADHVGQERTNSSRPLPVAGRKVREAQQQLEQARTDHQTYLALRAEVDRLGERARQIQRQMELVQATLAAREAETWAGRLAEARALAARYPDGAPSGTADGDILAQDVSAALQLWDARSEAADLSGRTAQELRDELGALPATPDGDLEPASAIVEAANALQLASAALQQHTAAPPPPPREVWTGGASESELRELARDLIAPDPAVDPILQEHLEQAQRRLDELAKPHSNKGAWIAVAVLLGLAVVTIPLVVPAVLCFLGAVGVAVWAYTRGGDKARVQALEDLRAAESAAGTQQHAVTETARRRQEACARAQALGLVPDASGLGALAVELQAAEQERREYERWQQSHQLLVQQRDRAEQQLGRALQQRGVEPLPTVVGALARYQQACTERKSIAAAAARRPALDGQLAAREREETLAAHNEERRQDAERALRNTAVRCQVTAASDEALADELRSWQRHRADTLTAQDTARTEWARLEAILDGQTLSQLEAAARTHADAAARLAEPFALTELTDMRLAADVEAQFADLSTASEEAQRVLYQKHGQAEERARNLSSVPEAEEGLAVAEAELERVQVLDQTLSRTREFLQRAQETVHRDIAPVLAQSVARWLPRVTTNRYTEVQIDPQTLNVRVRGDGRHWREARLLSHGTAEQIYLLLRVAMTERLTRAGEVCPLVLDDVTVQCDTERTIAVLEMLQVLSEERQVILFSQEGDVLTWAKGNLRPERDHLELLTCELVAV